MNAIRFHLGLNKSAIIRMKGTKYDCNPFQFRSNMSAMIEKFFSRDWSRNHSHVGLGRFLRLQSYKVPIILKIVLLFSPKWNWDCIHIRSQSFPWLQSYFIPFERMFAVIFSLHHKNYCNHKWSTPILYDSYLVHT